MKRRTFPALALSAGAAALVATGCGGGGGSDNPTKVAVDVTEQGNTATLKVPTKIDGGAVEFTLDNSKNKAPHDAQLIQLGDGHSYQEASSIINSDKPQAIPDWIRAYGGVGQTNPGETGTATVKLDEGHYALVDDAAQNGPGASGPPAHTEFDVSGDNGADLPDTDAEVTAATTGSSDKAHEYEWKDEGLKAGENTITFKSEGDEALHILAAIPVKGNASVDQISKELDSNGPPQSLDIQKGTNTSIIDGGKDQVTTLNLQPGKYAFVCFLPDRDEPDTPHFKQGLLKEVTIPSS